MKKSVIATGMALLAANISYAAPYQVELEAGYASAEGEAPLFGPVFDIDSDAWTIEGTYYINPVDNGKGPLAEAAFLDRASGLTFLYGEGEVEYERIPGEEEIDTYAFGGRFVDKESGWIFVAAHTNVKNDFSNLFDLEIKTDAWTFGVGKYIAENTEIMLSYDSVGMEENTLFDGFEFEAEADVFTLAVKHVAPLSGQMYYSVDASLAQVDHEFAANAKVWNGAFTLYPSRSLGVGASASITDSDDDETEVYSVFGHWFVTEQVALSLSYDMEENDESNFEKDVMAAGVTLRF